MCVSEACITQNLSKMSSSQNKKEYFKGVLSKEKVAFASKNIEANATSCKLFSSNRK